MSKTTNYQLTLWGYADEDFSPKQAREDLVANFTRLDMALKAEEAARIEATPQVAAGAYTGGVKYNDTTATQTIRLGFRPKAVCIMAQEGNGDSTILIVEGHPAIYGGDWIGRITATGFEVRNVTYRYLNNNEKTYHYWAVG